MVLFLKEVLFIKEDNITVDKVKTWLSEVCVINLRITTKIAEITWIISQMVLKQRVEKQTLTNPTKSSKDDKKKKKKTQP